MSVRKTVLALALTGAAIPAAFAGSASSWVGGELGFETHAVQSQLTRADVRQDFLAFRANPVTADGGRLVGGEAGYVGPQHSYAFVAGRLVHTDTIAHNTPKPSLVMSAQERRQWREQSVN